MKSPAPFLDCSSLAAFLNGSSDWIGQEMARYLPDREPKSYLYDLARDYPSRGGKRVRPALLLLSCTLAGGEAALALPSALALEMFQNFALVHDDIEDGSLLRRGHPTLHRIHGVPLAINAGDFLLGLVFELLAENEPLLGAAKAWEVQREFSRVFRETFEGQAMDIGWVETNHLPDRKEFETMIQKKTGWYTGRGPCQIGARIAGADEAVIAALGQFGQLLGIGFQVRDDLLNLAPDSSLTAPGVLSGGYGKERGGDIAEGKRTLVVIELLERLPPGEAERVREILMTPPAETSPEDINWVIDRAEQTGSLEAVSRHCSDLGHRAGRILEGLPPSPQTSLLESLTGYLIRDRNA
ncbi:MAG: polyprenyl synthetase family protein [Deltaproteobacteria bacterium]|nr:polyprenyl synthetase family protein [Deltaproteobacteria bacterium]